MRMDENQYMEPKDFVIAVFFLLILCAILGIGSCYHKEMEREKKSYHQMMQELYKGSGHSSSKTKTDTKPSESRSSGKSSTTRKPASEDPDPLNVQDYRDPEDFYEDHYDDFFDYEDAEDYYRDHGGF